MFGECKTFSGYSVNDIATAGEFYATVLGIRAEQNAMGLQLFLKEQHVFIYEKRDHQPATFTVLNFIVEDIDKAVEALIKADVTLERYDTLPAKQDDQGVLRGLAAGMGPDITWFKDPAGNILSVLQEA